MNKLLCYGLLAIALIAGGTAAAVPIATGYKLVLSDTVVTIEGCGKMLDSHPTFEFNSSVTIDTIRINEIVMSYGDHKKSLPLYVISESGNLYKTPQTFKNSLAEAELKGGGPMLLANQNYHIVYGEKLWKLTFVVPPLGAEELSRQFLDIVANKEGELGQLAGTLNKSDLSAIELLRKIINDMPSSYGATTGNEGGCPWWVVVLIAIAALCGGFAGAVATHRWLKKPRKKVDNPLSQSENDRQVEKELKAVAAEPMSSDTDIVDDKVSDAGSGKEETAEELIANLLDELSIGKGLDIKERITVLRQKLEGARTNEKALETIQKSLEVNTPADALTAITSIKNVRDDALKSISSLIEKIEKKNNKRLSDILNKARNDVRRGYEDGGYKYECGVLSKFVDILRSALPDTTESAKEKDSHTITDNQLDYIGNRSKLKTWLVRQLATVDIPVNSTDKLEDILKSLKVRMTDVERGNDEEIVSAAIKAGKLTEIDKATLLRRLIETINAQLSKEQRFADDTVFTVFVNRIATSLAKPNTHDDAQRQTSERDLFIVNSALDSQLTELSEDGLRKAVEESVVATIDRKVPGVSVSSLNDVATILRNSLNTNALLKKYGVEQLSDIVDAICQKDYESISKSVESRLRELLPDAQHSSTHQLVNQLLNAVEAANRATKDANDTCKLIAGDICERINKLRGDDSASPDASPIELMDSYAAVVEGHEAALQKDIAERDGDIVEKQGQIDVLKNDLASEREARAVLTADNAALMAESQKLVEGLRQSADELAAACRTILVPCSDAYESQCQDIEDRLFADLSQFVERLLEFNVPNNDKPAEVRTKIQQVLVDELSAVNSPLNTVCRYYAYSRLPFMTDSTREYGVIFRRLNISNLFHAIDNLLVRFGINVDIPVLFVAGFAEGNYDNLTGREFGDLDNLCQNSRNHYEKIDSDAKPTDVIVDMVAVGFSIDGQLKKKTSVLTY